MGTGQLIAIVAGLVLAVAAFAALLAGGLTTTTVETDTGGVVLELPPADGSYGIVVATYQTQGGLGFLGFDLQKAKWAAQVTFSPPEGCVIPEDGVLVAEGPCAGIPEGRWSAAGSAPDGTRIWNVEFEVSKACHEALELGEHWPTTKQACR